MRTFSTRAYRPKTCVSSRSLQNWGFWRIVAPYWVLRDRSLYPFRCAYRAPIRSYESAPACWRASWSIAWLRNQMMRFFIPFSESGEVICSERHGIHGPVSPLSKSRLDPGPFYFYRTFVTLLWASAVAQCSFSRSFFSNVAFWFGSEFGRAVPGILRNQPSHPFDVPAFLPVVACLTGDPDNTAWMILMLIYRNWTNTKRGPLWAILSGV